MQDTPQLLKMIGWKKRGWNMKKPIVRFDSSGQSGNIFDILGQCSKVFRKEHRINDFNLMRDRVITASSYKEALAEIRVDIDLIDMNEDQNENRRDD